jgi:hypothetical protein
MSWNNMTKHCVADPKYSVNIMIVSRNNIYVQNIRVYVYSLSDVMKHTQDKVVTSTITAHKEAFY